MGVMDANARLNFTKSMGQEEVEKTFKNAEENYAYVGELTVNQYTKLCNLIGNTVNILAMGTNDEDNLYIVVDTRDTDIDVVETLQRFMSLIGD